MKHKFKLLIFVTLLLHSCVIRLVNGNEYETLSEEYKLLIHQLKSFDNLKAKQVYEINGKQLIKELKNNQKSLVYIFANGCTSKNCIPLQKVEDYALEHELKLFLIMSSYYKIDETLKQTINHPLFSIDANFYQEKKSNKYVKKFKYDIGYNTYSYNKYLGGYIFYTKDKIDSINFSINNW